MSSRSRLVMTRRTTVGAALLAAGGCSFGGSGEPGATPSESPGVSDADFDLGLVDEARTQLGAMVDLVRRTSTKHAGLAPSLTTLAALHLAHDELLAESAGEPSPASTPAPVPAHRAKALALVRNREAALQVELANLAGRARSGPLARVLASMSAAVGQHVVGLPRPKRAR